MLNRIEYALTNNPVRALIQRRFEAKRLLEMGGTMNGGHALEVGCGCGVGTELIFEIFGVDRVNAFDLDPRMVALARHRLATHGSRVSLLVGDATAISAPDSTYDAVFDFGIIHHIPHWQGALAEIHRVLKPGGKLYAEEILAKFIAHPLARRLLEHPQSNRFNSAEFARELGAVGFRELTTKELWGMFAWFTARKPTMA